MNQVMARFMQVQQITLHDNFGVFSHAVGASQFRGFGPIIGHGSCSLPRHHADAGRS